jgi:hypothetical protein
MKRLCGNRNQRTKIQRKAESRSHILQAQAVGINDIGTYNSNMKPFSEPGGIIEFNRSLLFIYDIFPRIRI